MSDNTQPTNPRPNDSSGSPRAPEAGTDDPKRVGYGQPPVEHQFKKGEPTRNPWGRGGKPGKSRKLIKPRSVGDDFTGELIKAIVMDEAYRPVDVREGGKRMTMPSVRAIVRGQVVAGLKGNRLAAKIVMETVKAIETERCEEHTQYLRDIEKYKRNAKQMIARARLRGEPEPEMVPHPDDLIKSDSTGVVVIAGPINHREKVIWDKHQERRDLAQQEVSFCAGEYRKAKTPNAKARWLDFWLYAQEAFDLENDNLPVRYRRKLEDRSTAEGATRPGSKKIIAWPE